jgi:K+-transporting ATPase ATPase C chain
MRLWNQALRLLLVCSALTGLAYPLLMTAVAQWCCPWRANGSIVMYQGEPMGSQWIGQLFTDEGYFWGRPSATQPVAYNPMDAKGSNAAVAQPMYRTWLNNKVSGLSNKPIPADFVMASGSGLDPDISPETAFYQADRIAKARNMPRAHLDALIQRHIRWRTWGILGEPTVNVLTINQALEGTN